MTNLKPEDLALREIAALCMRWRCDCEEGDWPDDKAADLVSYIDKPHHGDCTNVPMTCLRCEAEAAYRQARQIAALPFLADRARMEKALREAERELAFAVEHMGRKGGGYERALVSVRQALGASQ